MTESSTAQPANAPPVRAHASARPKVIYVMGAGHSGTTILGVTLGNCAEIFYAGEVEEWLVNGGVPPYAGMERTRFWDRVRREVEGADELFGGEPNRLLERSSALFRIHESPARRRMRRLYRTVTERLFGAIADVAGTTHVVDTSHFPLRARELQALDGIELYLLFLVRDPETVVASYVREISRHEVAERRLRILATNANLWLTHLLSLSVFLRHPPQRRMFLRYEDFVAHPREMLGQILRQVDSPAAIPDLTSLRTGVPLVGNKLIRQEVVALTGPSGIPTRPSRLTRLLQLPWAPVLSRLQPSARPSGQAAPFAPPERQ